VLDALGIGGGHAAGAGARHFFADAEPAWSPTSGLRLPRGLARF
jgi:hypothetical protein